MFKTLGPDIDVVQLMAHIREEAARRNMSTTKPVALGNPIQSIPLTILENLPGPLKWKQEQCQNNQALGLTEAMSSSINSEE